MALYHRLDKEEIDMVNYFYNHTNKKNVVVFEGTSTKKINIEYTIKKPISTSVEEFTLLELLGNETIIMIIAGTSIILVGLALWKGKEINDKIENYIVDHTKLEKEESEEIDIDA